MRKKIVKEKYSFLILYSYFLRIKTPFQGIELVANKFISSRGIKFLFSLTEILICQQWNMILLNNFVDSLIYEEIFF